ncbi:MAG: exodeoxyribonuclease VII large subunit [Gammaproteobacteria bacterium]|jgi:exodeoxyribonuclease VII large subunit
MPTRPTRPNASDSSQAQALRAAPQKEVLTVSQLNRRARMTIEQRFSQIWVSGELSSFARPGSGHWYFTLKDNDAQVRCAMFANANRRARLQPSNGQQVLLRGRVSLYEGRGEFQVIVEHMEPAGEGALRAAFEALKRQLDAEGLFETQRKRALPELPRKVAVVTSPTGAALRDVLSVWQRRFPGLEVIVVPTLVQGAEAEAEILKALGRAEALAPDLILLTRGGGSMEDLWVFNAESITRALAAIEIPVVSAIGHEIDVAMTDFVADLRAPTPSAAAEVIVPDGEELAQWFDSQQRRLLSATSARLREQRLSAEKLALRLISPEHYCQQASQRLDDLNARLMRLQQSNQLQSHDRLREMANRLALQSPRRLLDGLAASLAEKNIQLRRAIRRRLEDHQQRLGATARMLESVSPLPTLSRGYAVLRSKSGSVVSQVTALELDQDLQGQLQDGSFSAKVTEIKPGDTLNQDGAADATQEPS